MNASLKRTVISSRPDSFKDYFINLWKFRSLIWIFAKRDLKVKYAQTIIGLGWTIIQPLTLLVIFTLFFGYLLKWKAEGLPYSVYILSGLLGWNFFSYVVTSGASSLQESSHLIRKVYFPKSVLPLSKVLVALVELLFSLLLLVPLLLYYQIPISVNVLLLPAVVFYNAICALVLVFWVAAFGYQRRDLFHLLPFVVYFGIWLTPIFFTTELLPESVGWLLYFNPMAHVVGLWRWSFLSFGSLSLAYLFGFLFMTFLCVLGMYFFSRQESKLSDHL
jgi:lipopolysaccharide transport system permease protein